LAEGSKIGVNLRNRGVVVTPIRSRSTLLLKTFGNWLYFPRTGKRGIGLVSASAVFRNGVTRCLGRPQGVQKTRAFVGLARDVEATNFQYSQESAQVGSSMAGACRAMFEDSRQFSNLEFKSVQPFGQITTWTIFLPRGCADAHSSPLLEESNTTEANVVKALPYLAGKPKGDRSMEGKRSARSTLSQEAAQARPHKVSPGLGQRQATRCR
jgi:hypothetical protein